MFVILVMERHVVPKSTSLFLLKFSPGKLKLILSSDDRFRSIEVALRSKSSSKVSKVIKLCFADAKITGKIMKIEGSFMTFFKKIFLNLKLIFFGFWSFFSLIFCPELNF